MEQRKSTTELRRELCDAGRDGVEELIKIVKEKIIIDDEAVTITDEGIESKADKAIDLAADKLTTAAKAKKIAMMDAFEMLNQIDAEETKLKSLEEGERVTRITPESRAKSKGNG
jgi:hypothetical protein